MKVLKNNYKGSSKWPRRETCPYCLSELEVEATDVVVNEMGGADSTRCPCCHIRFVLVGKSQNSEAYYKE